MRFKSTGAVRQVGHSYRDSVVFDCLNFGSLLAACAPTPIVTPDVSDIVDRTVTCENLGAHPDDYKDRIVELSG